MTVNMLLQEHIVCLKSELFRFHFVRNGKSHTNVYQNKTWSADDRILEINRENRVFSARPLKLRHIQIN